MSYYKKGNGVSPFPITDGIEITEEEYNEILAVAKANQLRLEEISTLVGKLNATDYKIIKCYEAQLTNQEMPYDIQALITERNDWREQINILEAVE